MKLNKILLLISLISVSQLQAMNFSRTFKSFTKKAIVASAIVASLIYLKKKLVDEANERTVLSVVKKEDVLHLYNDANGSKFDQLVQLFPGIDILIDDELELTIDEINKSQIKIHNGKVFIQINSGLFKVRFITIEQSRTGKYDYEDEVSGI